MPGWVDDHLDTVHNTADLVLPAAAGGQGLLQPQDAVEQLPLRQLLAHHPPQRRDDHGAHDTGCPQAAALGYRGQCRQLNAAPEGFEGLPEAPTTFSTAVW